MNRVIGIDYYQTITQDPSLFVDFTSGLISEGWKVHIITAVGPTRFDTVRAEIEALNVPNSTIEVVLFEHPREAPELKLAKCKELGVQMFIDDREDICRLLRKNGIVAMNIIRKDNSRYDFEKYPEKGIKHEKHISA